MKYYAVTDDPNELLHYGVKGMKWGEHIFGKESRPRSPAYKRVLGKLRNSIQKSVTQRSIVKQQRLQDKYDKAVQRAQKRIQIAEALSDIDTVRSFEKKANSDLKAERKANRIYNKQQRKYAKNEPKMEKYTQLAREGRLKYGKLSEDQINRIRDRLSVENATRSMGGRETPKFRIRMKEAIQEGILQGVSQGTAAGMKEVAIAKVQNRLKNKRALDKENRIDAQRQKEATRIKNTRTAKEIRQDIKTAAYESEVASGKGFFDRSFGKHMSVKNAGRILQENNKRELDRKFAIDEEYASKRAQRQNLENDRKSREKLMLDAERAYKYGYIEGGNPGGKDQKAQAKLDSLRNLYDLSVVQGKTLQQIEAEKAAERDKLNKKMAREAARSQRKKNFDESYDKAAAAIRKVRNRYNTAMDNLNDYIINTPNRRSNVDVNPSDVFSNISSDDRRAENDWKNTSKKRKSRSKKGGH